MLETVFEKIGMDYKAADFADRLERAKFWLEQCAPDQVNKLRKTRNFEVYNTLTDEEKKTIELLCAYIRKGGYTLDELNAELYAIPKTVYGTDMPEKELKALQGNFFKNVYNNSPMAAAPISAYTAGFNSRSRRLFFVPPA